MQLPEALGEIDHIFCDKTGTLTQNDLDVQAFSVMGKTCRGLTRNELMKQMEKNSKDEEHLDQLAKCICLCNDLQVMKDSQGGQEKTYDGASQEEIILNMLL